MATPMTATDDNIIINELLWFYINRMDVFPRSVLHRIILENVTDTDITNAKDVLHSHISISLINRRIKRQGSDREKNNIDDISKVLDEIDPNHIPYKKIPFKYHWMVLGSIMANSIWMVSEWYLNGFLNDILDFVYHSMASQITVESTTESCWKIIEWYNGIQWYSMVFNGIQWYSMVYHWHFFVRHTNLHGPWSW